MAKPSPKRLRLPRARFHVPSLHERQERAALGPLAPQPEPVDLSYIESLFTSRRVRTLAAELRRLADVLENHAVLLDTPEYARLLILPDRKRSTDRDVRALMRSYIARRVQHIELCIAAWCQGQPFPPEPGAHIPESEA